MLNKNYLLPSAYLAPTSYYSILIKYPNSIIEQYEHFTKQTIRDMEFRKDFLEEKFKEYNKETGGTATHVFIHSKTQDSIPKYM